MVLHTRPTRRQFAGSVGALVGVGLAGCTSDANEETSRRPPVNTPISEACESDNQELPDLRVRNRHSEPHTVDLIVTGEREDGSSETVYEESFDLGPETDVENPDSEVVRWIAFDPDEADIERYEDFRATATTDDGQTDSRSVYTTVVEFPLRYGLRVEMTSGGRLRVSEIHWDAHEGWEPAC